MQQLWGLKGTGGLHAIGQDHCPASPRGLTQPSLHLKKIPRLEISSFPRLTSVMSGGSETPCSPVGRALGSSAGQPVHGKCRGAAPALPRCSQEGLGGVPASVLGMMVPKVGPLSPNPTAAPSPAWQLQSRQIKKPREDNPTTDRAMRTP